MSKEGEVKDFIIELDKKYYYSEFSDNYKANHPTNEIFLEHNETYIIGTLEHHSE